MPLFRTKRLTGLQDDHGNAIRVRGIHPDRVPPPVHVEPALRVLYAEEDDQQTKPDTGVQTRAEDVIVSHPPAEVIPTDKVVEYEPGDRPGRVVDP